MNEDMVRQWIHKADNDLKAGKDEFLTKEPATDTICFHMQQCSEKYLKSYLVYCGKEIPRTHNLALIAQLCIEEDSSFNELLEKEIDILTDYAVITRYPDEFYMPTIEETQNAIVMAELVKGFVAMRLKNDDSPPYLTHAHTAL